MRIDVASKSNTAVNTSVGDLISRLNAGDVIRAKVIEITSDEAVLRLFDGTTMKAKLTEKLDANVGQTITLSVASKSEGTLVLETVRDMNSRLQIKPDILKNILESLNLKPDNKNTEVAAELIKAGQPVTKASIGKALLLMEAIPDMTADKAVFLTSKNIGGSQLDPGLTNKLLNGDLKLGGLLGDLQSAIEQAPGNAANSEANPKNADNMPQELFDRSSRAAAAKSSQASESPSVSADSHGNPVVTVSGRQTSGADVKSPAIQTAATDGKAAMNGSTAASGQYPEADNIRTGSTEPDSNQNSTIGLSGKSTDYVQAGKNSGNDFPAGPAALNAPSEKGEFISSAESSIDGSPENGTIKAAGKGQNVGIANLSADETVSRHAEVKSAPDAFSKMNEAIKDVFVSTDSDKLASELEVDKLYKELDSRLDAVKAAAHTSDLPGVKADIISNAANMISDTIKLINQLNSGGLTYYQIPVRISDSNTTAELYILKKQRNKKKIDPNNTVMFIALDTKNLGRVETLIDVKGKNIGIQLRTGKQEINDYIEEYTKDLYNGLSELGYKLTGIRFKVIDEPATPMKQERLLEEMEQGYMGRIDFRI